MTKLEYNGIEIIEVKKTNGRIAEVAEVEDVDRALTNLYSVIKSLSERMDKLEGRNK